MYYVVSKFVSLLQNYNESKKLYIKEGHKYKNINIII